MQISKLFLPEVSQAIESGDLESLRAIFEDLHPSDVAELLAELSPERIAAIVRILRAPGIKVFEQLSLEVQAAVLKHLGRSETVKILEEMPSDDRVDLLKKLPDETVDSLLPLMAQADRDDVRKLLEYGERTAGSLMTTEYASLPAQITVLEALATLRSIAPDRETIYYVYVTDPNRHLLGTVSLRDLVTAKPIQKLEELMQVNPISFTVDTDQEEVAKAVAKYDFLAVPVVDKERRLVGIVTHDDALDVMVEEQTEDVQRMGAIEPVHEPYFRAKFWLLAQKRGLWLALLFVSASFTGTALRFYHSTLEHALTLALFVPLIISSGGNSGSQSVTLITRGLALGDIRGRDILRVMMKEGMMGLVLGLFLGTLGFFRAWMWDSSYAICFSVALALIGVVTAGSLIGATLPLLFKRLGFDPAIMSSPFVATIVDVTGIVIYFSVAQALI